jgi:hypothetical protein
MFHVIHVVINHHPYTFEDPNQTGLSLKQRAGIPEGDVLFKDRPHEDEVITNQTTVTLENGDRFHSAPPADYGDDASTYAGGRAIPQPDGWTFVVFDDYRLPAGYRPSTVSVLVKLPPTFPDAQPDTFAVRPALKTRAGVLPRGTSNVLLLEEEWQSFSWHLAAGAWRPGISTMKDFMRSVRARFEKGD